MKALALALVIGWGCGSVARAAPSTPGQQLYEAGERAFHQHRWEEARRSFAAAYELDRKPELLYDVALAAWRIAREDETVASLQAARAAFQRYLDEATAGRRRKPAEQALADIDAQLPKPNAPKPSAPAPGHDHDDEEDGARPLDPYGNARKLGPLPKPIIIGNKPEPKVAEVPKTTEPLAMAPQRQPMKSVPPPDAPPPDAPPVEPPRAPAKGPKYSVTPMSALAAAPPPAKTHAKAAATQRRWLTPVIVVGALCVVGLAVGLGVGLTQSSGSSPNLGSITY